VIHQVGKTTPDMRSRKEFLVSDALSRIEAGRIPIIAKKHGIGTGYSELLHS
jgi:hypothetical protein